MSYLFAALSVVWSAFFLYVWYLVRRVARVELELKALGDFIEEQGQER
ncbi:MAG: CcmD family protein [Candidatus Bipolaricaulia bacterium]